MLVAPAVEAEDEFIKGVGGAGGAARDRRPRPRPPPSREEALEVGKDPVKSGQDDMGGHFPTTWGSLVEAGGAGISRPTIGLGGGTWREIGSEQGTKAGSRIIGDLAKADAPRTTAAVLDLNGTDDQHFALIAAFAATGDRIVLAAAGDFGFIHLN
jgi:hypothetical protein